MRYRLPSLGAIVAGFVAAFAADPEHLVAYEFVDLGIPTSLTGVAGDPAHGREIVVDLKLGNCLACHKIPALGDEPFHGDLGPSLAGVAKRYTEAELRFHLVDPKQIYPDTIMPAFYKSEGFNRAAPEFTGKTILTAEQVEDVVAFLLTLNEEGDTFVTPQIPRPSAASDSRTSSGQSAACADLGLRFRHRGYQDDPGQRLRQSGLLLGRFRQGVVGRGQW